MLFYINESYTPELCTRQAEFNKRQMNKLDSEIADLRKVLKAIPSWESPAPEDYELVCALINKIEYLSDHADNYEKQVDYWLTQKRFAILREVNN